MCQKLHAIYRRWCYIPVPMGGLTSTDKEYCCSGRWLSIPVYSKYVFELEIFPMCLELTTWMYSYTLFSTVQCSVIESLRGPRTKSILCSYDVLQYIFIRRDKKLKYIESQCSLQDFNFFFQVFYPVYRIRLLISGPFLPAIKEMFARVGKLSSLYLCHL